MNMLLKTPYQLMVAAIKRDMLTEFDRAEQQRRAEEAFDRFMRSIGLR